MIKILFLGDIVGKIARKALTTSLQEIQKELQPDLTIANVENLAHGTGITKKTLKEMQEAGIDFFTSGNHIWKKREAKTIFIEGFFPVIRPANYPPSVDGTGEKIIEIWHKGSDGSKKAKGQLLVMNLLGRVFFQEDMDCPFRKSDEILEKYRNEKLSGIIVDFHAEATSEKVAFAHYLNGRVSAIIGTHTHIATADNQILSGGTAYITDVGMVGAKDSVIGVDKKNILEKFLKQIPVDHEIPKKGIVIINAVVIEIDECTNKAVKIDRVYREVEVG